MHDTLEYMCEDMWSISDVTGRAGLSCSDTGCGVVLVFRAWGWNATSCGTKSGVAYLLSPTSVLRDLLSFSYRPRPGQ
jgi:hypothetical protein